MRNILRVLRGDLRRMTASVVAIVTLMGLCIIPCLYAWFNIFSNWAPYDTEPLGVSVWPWLILTLEQRCWGFA